VNAILVNPVEGTLSSPVAVSGAGDVTPVDLKNPLHSNVCVSADFGGGGPNAFVSVLNVAITENALDGRTYVATQAFLDNIANQQQQQQIKKAQDTAAPKL
jgi:hypothetical protein